MAKGPSYRVPFRRRLEGKTDYKSRRALVLSGIPRLVVRGTLKHIIVQFIEAKINGDYVIASANSQELIKIYDWQGACGNIPAAYLTGLLSGYRAVNNELEKAVLDIGLQLPSQGSRVFAALKGVIDAGISVPHSKSILPDKDRIMGQHIANYAQIVTDNSETSQKDFSKYLLRGFNPKQFSEHFSFLKEKIASSFQEEIK
jgi:large subunit ribosomal protein L18